MASDSLYFFEMGDFSLRFARCSISETSLRIEEIREALFNDTAALGPFAPPGTPVVCAFRPKPRYLQLATALDAKRHAGRPGVQRFAQLLPFTKMEQAWFACAQAADGEMPTDQPWLLSLCSEPAYAQAAGWFEAIKLRPARCLDATIATAGALVSAVPGPTLLLEIGELASHAILLGPDGVRSVLSLSLKFEDIVSAVQDALQLSFRGAAVRLFFDSGYDFTTAGPAIADRLRVALQHELKPLLALQSGSLALYCTGLPAGQRWLGRDLAASLGLTPFVPAIEAWSSTVGLTFATPELQAGLMPDWFHFLHFINSQTLDAVDAIAWQAEWLSLGAPIVQGPAKVLTPPTVPAEGPAVRLATAIASTMFDAPKADGRPLEGAKETPAGPTKPAPHPALPTAERSAVSPSPMPARESDPVERPRRGYGLVIGIVLLVGFLLAAGGYQYNERKTAEAARLASEATATAGRLKAADEAKQKLERELSQAKASLAEEKARRDAEIKRQLAAEEAAKAAQAEAARVAAEQEAIRQAEAVRRASARGNLVITTIPAGANVTVGDRPTRSSPVTFPDLPIGKYPVTITLSRHEDVKMELEVIENGTTESGPVNLVSFAGTLDLVTEPAGVDFEAYPVNTAIVSMDAQRTGKTPAKVEDLDPGDYSVTFSRAGWTPHTETVTVLKNATVHIGWTFPTGTLRINSTPSGATVMQGGAKLGVTPVTVTQPAGTTRFTVSLAGFDPVELTGEVESGKPLELTASLRESDRTYGVDELEQPPVAIIQKTPTLPDALTLVDGRIVIQMTVNRDGTPCDIKIVRASNPELGQIYLAAAARWKFKPGMAAGRPVRSTVMLPILVRAAKY